MTQDTQSNGQTQALSPYQERRIALREEIGQDAEPRAIVPRTFAEAQSFADAIAHSSLVPAALQQRAPDILMIVLAGAEQGIAPIRALSLFHVVEGVPKLSADGLAGKVMSSPLCEYLEPIEQTPGRVSWRGKRRGRPELVVSYSIDEANQAGLLGKNNWRKHPMDMLNARCKARICRLIWPDLAAGITTAEEALDNLEGPTTGAEFAGVATATQSPLERQGPPPGVPPLPTTPANTTPPTTNKATNRASSKKSTPPATIDTTATESTPTSTNSAAASSNGNASTPANATSGSATTSTASTSGNSTNSSASSTTPDTASDATVSNSATDTQPSVPAEDESGFGGDDEADPNVRTIERFEALVATAGKNKDAADLGRIKADWLPWSKDESATGGKQHAHKMRAAFAAAQKAIEGK